jgi:peptidoglycan hydrolase-like protein with peptidoglycan-binding domain
VVVVQVELNRIAQNYPAIPKIANVDGIYGSRTEASVRRFQEIFGLTPDGIVGPATWYALVRLYTAVTQLSELRSQGQQFYSISWAYPNGLQSGATGDKVRHLQYMLSVLSAYINSIPPVTVDGIFGPDTRSAVVAAQRYFGLPQTGIVDERTWDEIYDQFAGIENTSLRSGERFPTQPAAVQAFARQNPGRGRYAGSTTLTQFPGDDLRPGRQDPVRQEVIR